MMCLVSLILRKRTLRTCWTKVCRTIWRIREPHSGKIRQKPSSLNEGGTISRCCQKDGFRSHTTVESRFIYTNRPECAPLQDHIFSVLGVSEWVFFIGRNRLKNHMPHLVGGTQSLSFPNTYVHITHFHIFLLRTQYGRFKNVYKIIQSFFFSAMQFPWVLFRVWITKRL